MIASLEGIIDAVSKDNLVVNVNGIGFKVTVTTSVLSEMGITGREVRQRGEDLPFVASLRRETWIAGYCRINNGTSCGLICIVD